MPAPAITPETVCFSCLKQCQDEDYRGECLTCGTLICGIGDCKGTCPCILLGERDDADDE